MQHLIDSKYDAASDFDDESWQQHANCLGVDPDLFFIECLY